MLKAADGFRTEVYGGEDTSQYQYADYVIQIPDDVDIMNYPEDSKIVMRGYDGTINAGDTFAYENYGIPYVYKAASVTVSNGEITIQTEDADEDALLSAEYTGSFTPEITDFEPDTDLTVVG